MLRTPPSPASVALLSMFVLVGAACDSPTTPVRARVSIDGPPAIRFTSINEPALLSASVQGATSADLVWRSTNTRIASVDRSGAVISVADGEAFVIASVGGAADSVMVTVAQTAASASFVGQPEHLVIDESFATPIRVAIQDALGNPVANVSAAVTLDLSGEGGGILMGTATVPAVNGVAVFDDLMVTAIGEAYRLHATVMSNEAQAFAIESVAFDVVAAPDVVLLRNGAAAEAGLLVDGLGASGIVNDRGYLVADSMLHLVFNASPQSNEILAFTRERPPVAISAPWTAAPDTIPVTFPERIEVPVTIWIVRGPYSTQQQRAAAAVATTLSIWNAERMGIVFSEVEYVDATANADASALFEQTLCNQQARTTASIGQRPGKINVYYVASVDGGTGRGRACGTSFIIMAEQSGHELLSHEIGHSFGLGHVDGDSRYDQTNVMHSASNVRQFLTEGQVFRSHYNSFSALRSVYAARTDAARNCADSSGSTTCPALERRLWPDGSFPSDEPLLQMDLQVARWLLADCDVGETPVADALLEASHEAAESALLDVLDSADWAGNERVRTRAIQGLGLVGDDRAVTRLRHLADSTSGYANAAKAAIAAIDARQR